MKQLIHFVMPLKIFAALMFAGLIGLYVATAILQHLFTGESITSYIPFLYLFHSVILSVVCAILWSVCLHHTLFKKWRFFPRYLLFAALMISLLSFSLFTFLALPEHWMPSSFFLVLCCFTGGITVFFALNEHMHKKTGERYLNVLSEYQKTLPQ